jgi:hypothetical protein
MARNFPMRIDQGSTYSQIIQVNDNNGVARNLTGYTAKMSIRKAITDATTVLDLTSPAGGITINGAAGQLTITITDEQTSAMTWTTGVYDIKITSSGGVAERILEGAVSVFPQVTV